MLLRVFSGFWDSVVTLLGSQSLKLLVIRSTEVALNLHAPEATGRVHHVSNNRAPSNTLTCFPIINEYHHFYCRGTVHMLAHTPIT